MKMRAARVKNNSLFISTIPICPREGETKVEREEGRQTLIRGNRRHPRGVAVVTAVFPPTRPSWAGRGESGKRDRLTDG